MSAPSVSASEASQTSETSPASFDSRVVYAAAHVVADPNGDNGPGKPAVVDWDATLRFRHHLWSLGFGIADAMDTAQRGMGLDWAATQELIKRSGAEAKAVGGRIACGVGTDHITPEAARTPDGVFDAYCEQLEVVQNAGARPIIMASRALAAASMDGEKYRIFFSSLFTRISEPVILHWLGPMFDPALAGYWGSGDLAQATENVLAIIRQHAPMIDGIKVSLLDADHEIALRRALPDGVKMYTGDDFNYPDLIKGDEVGFSHALLGIFDGIARPASAALKALDAGDLATYDRLMAPTIPLSRHIFQEPTFNYKTGLVFLAYLNGHQDHFRMVGGLETSRDAMHLVELHRLAGVAGVLDDPDLASRRLAAVLESR